MRFKRRDALWLALALLLHALLLLIPLKHPPAPGSASKVISVALLTPHKEQALILDETLPPAPAEPTETVEELLPQQLPPRLDEPAQPEVRASAGSANAPLVNTTTARLLDSASSLKWSLPEPVQDRQPGVFSPRAVPRNWRPKIVVEDNRFNGMVVPTKTEIVDRWMAANGTHNVVLNTPSGDTMCGRAQPRNPMNPVLEPIFTLWKCGGGGARLFKMPDRYMRFRQHRVLATAGGIR